jgi:hypothetical protein
MAQKNFWDNDVQIAGAANAPVAAKADAQARSADASATSSEVSAKTGQAKLPYVADTAKADLSATQQKLKLDRDKYIDDLRGQYTKTPAYVQYDVVIPTLAEALHTANDSTGDLNLTYAAAKIFDPGSVVRESEQENMKAAQAALESKRQDIMKQFGFDHGVFTPENREKLRRELIGRASAANKAYNRVRVEYQTLAKERGLPVSQVIGPHVGAPFMGDLASYDKQHKANSSAALEDHDGRVPLLDAPPAGATLGGAGIKGWRLSQEGEQAATEVLRNGGSAEEYANAVADRAVAEGKIKPEERDTLIASTLPATQKYIEDLGPDPKVRAAIPGGINYETIDAKAQHDAPLGEKVAQGLRNVPTSAAQLAEGVISPVVDAGLSIDKGEPVGTIKGLHALATDSDARSAALTALSDRYLTGKGLENAAITDPLGIAGDLSMVLTGGGTAAGRLPGMGGKLGRLAAKVGEVIDPITGVRKVGDYAASGFKPNIAEPFANAAGTVGREVIGVTTGQPRGSAFSRAFAAGKEGGARGERFRQNMRGDADPNDLIAQADSALAQMQREASAQYRSGMVDVSNDKTILDFADIDQTLADLEKRAFYKGEVRDAAAAKAWTDTKALVDDWKAKDPAEFHTPEGMDVLKQKVGDLGSSYQMGNDRNAAAVATQLYGAVKKAVADQVPTYAKTMEDYASKADQLREIRTTFSLNPKASVDTKLRKLFSSARNNVNTNFGQREKLTEMMDRYTGGKLIDDVSAQNLSSVIPRGIGGPLTGAVATGGAAGLGVSALGGSLTSLINPANLAYLPLTSPRLMGETAHAAGRASRKIGEGIDVGLAGVRKPLQPLLDLQKKYPGVALTEARGVAGLEGVADERERSSRPPIAIDAPPEVDLSNLTEEEKAMLLEERRKQMAMAYGGPVRRLSQRYACGGPVRRRG